MGEEEKFDKRFRKMTGYISRKEIESKKLGKHEFTLTEYKKEIGQRKNVVKEFGIMVEHRDGGKILSSSKIKSRKEAVELFNSLTED